MIGLQEIPVIGNFYEVDCTNLNGTLNVDIPILNSPHNDSEITDQKFDHTHVDYRFICDVDLERVGNHYKCFEPHGHFSRQVSIPALIASNINIYKKRLQCLRHFCVENDNSHVFKVGTVQKLAEKNKYSLNMESKICPHHGTNLKSCKVIDGVITCPAHGLRFSAKTGELV